MFNALIHEDHHSVTAEHAEKESQFENYVLSAARPNFGSTDLPPFIVPSKKNHRERGLASVRLKLFQHSSALAGLLVKDYCISSGGTFQYPSDFLGASMIVTVYNKDRCIGPGPGSGVGCGWSGLICPQWQTFQCGLQPPNA
jgi:hypothetical protein